MGHGWMSDCTSTSHRWSPLYLQHFTGVEQYILHLLDDTDGDAEFESRRCAYLNAAHCIPSDALRGSNLPSDMTGRSETEAAQASSVPFSNSLRIAALGGSGLRRAIEIVLFVAFHSTCPTLVPKD